MRTLGLLATLTALLVANGQVRRSVADEAAAASTLLPQVVEVDDLILPTRLTTQFDLNEVPQAIRRLDGQNVRIHGYIGLLPTEEPVSQAIVYGATQGGVYQGFHWEKPVHLMIATRLRAPQAFRIDESVVIEGVFRVRPIVRNSKLRILYFLEDAVATPARPRDGYHNSVGWGC